jgi:uncharacterized protein YraI
MLTRRKLLRVLMLEAAGCLALAAAAYAFVYRPLAALPPPTVTALAASLAAEAAPGTMATAATPRPTRPAASPTSSPAATATPTATPSATAMVAARVAETGAGLRLRASPGTAGEILRELEALTPLSVVGRTEDGTWLEVMTAAGERGWVSAVYVTVEGDPANLPITGQAVAAAPGSLGYLSGVSATAREIHLRGRALGKRDFAFSVVGDSNTDNPAFLLPFDLGGYDLGDYATLQLTIDYFAGSFSRDSAAALGGFNTSKVLDPSQADGRCAAGESPLSCEFRLHQPSVALILLGTGDQHSWQGFEARYRQIVEYSLAEGVVPVLITKADDLESLENTAAPGYINTVIRQLAREYDVPLLDLRQAVELLPNRGCLPDGFHYNTPPDGRSAVFDAAHLQYGYTVRNLTALQALDALRQYVLYAPLND